MTACILMLLKLRASPDKLPFCFCNKNRLAIEQTTLSNDTIDSILRHREGRAKDLSAPPLSVRKFSDSYESADSAELFGFCYSGEENKGLHAHPDYIKAPAKDKQPCCQTDICIEASHTLLLFLLHNCTHCQQISTSIHLTLAYI